MSFSCGNARYGRVLIPTPSSSIAISEIMFETNSRLWASKRSASVPSSNLEVPLRIIASPCNCDQCSVAPASTKGWSARHTTPT
ncbi:hypothetical protein D3C77_740250 [compost metagenome]